MTGRANYQDFAVFMGDPKIMDGVNYFDEENQRIELLSSGSYLDSPQSKIEIRITYTAGFDFTDNTEEDIESTVVEASFA